VVDVEISSSGQKNYIYNMMRSQHPPHTTIFSLIELCNLMMAR